MEQAITTSTLRNEVRRAQKVILKTSNMLPYKEVTQKYNFAIREVGAFFFFSNVSSKLTIPELINKAQQVATALELLDKKEIEKTRYSFDERRLVDATRAALENIQCYYLLRVEKLEEEAEKEK